MDRISQICLVRSAASLFSPRFVFLVPIDFSRSGSFFSLFSLFLLRLAFLASLSLASFCATWKLDNAKKPKSMAAQWPFLTGRCRKWCFLPFLLLCLCLCLCLFLFLFSFVLFLGCCVINLLLVCGAGGRLAIYTSSNTSMVAYLD
jgi:hypothetical protein